MGAETGENPEATNAAAVRFQARLTEVVQPEEIPRWLDTPNDAFDGLKPLEVIERGEIDRLWSMIFYLEAGLPS